MSQASSGQPPGPKSGTFGQKPGAKPPSSQTAKPSSKQWSITTQQVQRGQKVVLYGTGGIGKTTLASLAPGVVVADLEKRTGHVQRKGEEAARQAGTSWTLQRLDGIGDDGAGNVDPWQGWHDTRSIVQAGDQLWKPGMTMCLDSLTLLEDWCQQAILVDRPKGDQGQVIRDIEDYGFGKGYNHAFKQMVSFLRDLDVLAQKGVNVILICHDCQTQVLSPITGEYTRYEPRLYKAKNGNSDLRAKVKEWADHVLFLHYDEAKTKDGRAEGQGTRTIYCHERPAFMAKSSVEVEELPMTGPFDGTVWNHVFANPM